MKKSTYIISVFVALIVGAVGSYVLFHQGAGVVATANPGGTNYSSARVLAQNINTSTSTFFSYGPLASDFVITGTTFHAYGSAATSSNYVVQCATSSTPYPAVGTNSNLFFNSALNPFIGTTTGAGLYHSSTSPGVTGIPFGSASTTARLISSGSYAVCSSTDSVASTNSANTFDSNTTGILGISGFAE